MEFDGKKITKAYDEAKKLVKNFDSEFKSAAFNVIFELLLLENKITVAETKTKKLSQKRSIKSGSPSKKGPMDQLKDLVSEDFFSSSHSMKEILQELDSRGHSYEPKDLTGQLNTLVRNKNLRRTKKKIGKKTVIHWINW